MTIDSNLYRERDRKLDGEIQSQMWKVRWRESQM